MSTKLFMIPVLTAGLLMGGAASPSMARELTSDLTAGASRNNSPAAHANPGFTQLSERRGGGKARSHGARTGGHEVNRNINRNTNVNRNTNINRDRNVNRSTNINRDTNINVNRNRDVNVQVNVRTRPYGWRGARWGTVAFGVTMGAIIVVAANTPPPPPDPSLCWTWTNSTLTEGYWYYCAGS